jgi:hypothetical protein
VRRINKRKYLVHRLVWEQAHGPIPEGMVVMHICDNPPCYNLEHLRLGTQDENIRDMRLKGRSKSKLSTDDVLAILSSNDSAASLGRRYGVSDVTVLNIRHGKAWRHIHIPSNSQGAPA